MAQTKINHEARKERILAESIKRFAREGYSAVNMGMIAAAVGLSRTLLYTYYRDKRVIFNEAISGVTSRIEAKYAEVMRSRQCADAKLRQICVAVFAMLFDNRDFVCVIADVLANERRKGEIPVERVDAHTRGLKRILRSLINEAVRRGEYQASVDPLRMVRLIYSQFEAVALRITVTGRAEISECIDQLDAILFSMRSQDNSRRRILA